MSGRLGAVVVGASALVIALFVVGTPPPPVDAATMCPPTTLDDLEPPPTSTTDPNPTTTVTTAPSGTTTTTIPVATTTIPVATTTTLASATTTTLASTTTTTMPAATTTLPDATTTTVPSSATTTLPGQTTTTVPAGTGTTAKPRCEPFVYRMTYPLAFKGSLLSVFGAERDGGVRLHKGVDLGAPRLTHVVATRDGTVSEIHNDVGTDECCWLSIRHQDGWQSWYLHLNNDTYGTDDGFGLGVRIDLQVGDSVAQGELLGWLGDSGNAEGTSPHLHYELRDRRGVPVDAGTSLRKASSRAPRSDGNSGAYLDDDGSLYEWIPDALAARGISWTCDELTSWSCPDDIATPEQLARLAELLLGVQAPPLEGSYGVVTLLGLNDPHPFLIEKMLGCGDAEECPAQGVTETELSRLAAGILEYRHRPESNSGLFGGGRDDLTIPSQIEAISYLVDGGHVASCEIPLDSTEILHRGRAVYLLLSWTGEVEVEACPTLDQPLR